MSVAIQAAATCLALFPHELVVFIYLGFFPLLSSLLNASPALFDRGSWGGILWNVIFQLVINGAASFQQA